MSRSAGEEGGRGAPRAASTPLREKTIAQNRQARHEYHILDTLEAGMVLTGTEVKSLREGRAQLKDSYVSFEAGEPFLVGAHINPFSHGNRANHEPERKRKLLLNATEAKKWNAKVSERGCTVVPLRLYFKGARVKLEIALATGKKLHDKRDALRERDLDREAAADVKSRR